MAKILLVEDDNNLREIYEARLQAEGYTIASAKDGEEALVKAKQERPDLIISDVMMPRISGFEMLDILRNTEGLKDAKVIMLTALGQAEDKTRADTLGADRYLVKSQVTLEDIVKAADELLSGPANPPTTQPTAPISAPAATTAAPASAPTEPTSSGAATAPDVAPTIPVTPVAPNPSIPVAQPPAVQSTPIPVSQPPAEPTAAPSTPAISMPTPPAASMPPAKPVETPATSPATGTGPQPPATAAEPANIAPVQASPPVMSTPSPTASAGGTAPSNAPAARTVSSVTAQTGGTPASTQPKATDTTAADDKLIEDAVKNLTATLASPAEPAAEKPAEVGPADTATKPSIPAATTTKTAPSIAPPTSSTEQSKSPPTTEKPATPSPAPPSTPIASPAPIAPPASAPAPVPAEPIAQRANTTADEQAAMESQIEDFIAQQAAAPQPSAADTVQSSPQTTETGSLSSAPAVASITPEPPKQPISDSVQPQAAPTEAAQAPDEAPAGASDEDNVAIAHKKIIQPPVEPMSAQPDLSELLAREGINVDEDHPEGQPAIPGAGTPHPPGHVISPNATADQATANPAPYNPNDPNSIAL